MKKFFLLTILLLLGFSQNIYSLKERGTCWYNNIKYRVFDDGTAVVINEKYEAYLAYSGYGYIDAHSPYKGDIVIPKGIYYKRQLADGSYKNEWYNVTEIAEGAFYYANVNSINLSENISAIGKHAFAHSSITSIEIPKNVLYLGEYAFAECQQLTAVAMIERITKVPKSLFPVVQNYDLFKT